MRALLNAFIVVVLAGAVTAGVSPDNEIFLRGDANSDTVVDGADASYTSSFLFQGGPPPGCMEAADANGDGVVDGADPAFIMNYLYSGGKPPPAPFPTCKEHEVVISCDSPICP